MIDERRYRETFSHLRASEHAKQEVIEKMNEAQKTKRFPRLLRTAAIAAMLTVALAVTAGAVNAATDGGLFQTFSIIWNDGMQLELVSKNGEHATANLVEANVEKADGRLILRAMGQEVDITDAMAGDGFYRLEDEESGRAVEVSGDTEHWTVTMTGGDEDGVTYSLTTYDGDSLPEDQGTVVLDGTVGAEKGKSVTLSE